jgi:outer membrane autotransporter protein
VAEPGATLGVDLDLTVAQADKILVSGPATLAGTVRLNVLNAATGAATQRAGETTYTLLSAAGGTTHTGLQLDAMSTAVARYALTYPNPRDVVLTQTVDFAPQGLIGNQIAVGAAVNAIQAAQGTPAFGPVATALFFQSDRARLGAVYDGLSGEGTLAHQQTSVLAIDRFTTNMVNRMASWLDGDRIDPFAPQGLPETASSFAPARQPHPALGLIASLETRRPSWRMWSAGFGAYGTARGVPVSNLAATSQRDAGYAAGLDYRFGEHGLVGIAAGWSHAGFTVRDRATTGRIEAGHGAVYGALRDERAYVFGSLGVGVFNDTTRRFATIPGSIVGAIVVPGFNERLVGKFGSTALTGYLEAGYRMSSGRLTLTPFVAVQPSWLHSSAYQETNDGASSSIGLSFPQRDVRSLPVFAGAQISATLQLSEKVTLSTSLRAAWKREFETARGQSPSFNAAPAVPFMVRGAPATRDMARVQAGLQVNVGNSLSLFSHFGVILPGPAARSRALPGFVTRGDVMTCEGCQ